MLVAPLPSVSRLRHPWWKRPGSSRVSSFRRRAQERPSEAVVSTPRPTVAVLATMNTKSKEARFVARALSRAGVRPWIVDLSLKTHSVDGIDMNAASVVAAAGASWQALNEQSRQEAAAVMIAGGSRILTERFLRGKIAGAIG